MEHPSTILLIGTDSETRHRMTRLVAHQLPNVVLAVRDEAGPATEYATIHPVDGIVVDGTEDALGSCRELKAHAATQSIPLMLLSQNAREVFKEANRLGVEDFIAWSASDDELASRLRWMTLLRNVRQREQAALERVREMESAHRKALRTAEGRYRQLVETWPDTLIVCTDNMVTSVNEAGRQLLGPTFTESLIGKPIFDIVRVSDRPAIRQLVERFHHQEENTPYQLMQLNGPDGHSIHVEAAAVGFERTDGRHVLLVLRDVGEREHLSRKFQKAQRMEAVGQLAGGVAHDFNNILTSIRGYSDFVLDSLAEGDPMAEEIREIKNATERAASLTRQLLAFSRRQVMAPSAIELNRVVLDIKRMLTRIIGEQIELTTDLDPDIGIIRADRSQIEQVIMNLAVNARDAIAQNGTVTLSTRNVIFDDNADMRGLDLEPGRFVLLKMSDTGVGMSEETALRIFEPFFTTKESDKGTGLGLSTVYGIVKQTGGDITVDSTLGEGTTFSVYLPVRPELDAAMAPVSTEQGPARGWETILLVEDDSTVRYLARRLLERAGYTAISASNGREALRLAADHDGPIHLVVTDVIMPEMGGPELARQILRTHPELKVIFMSGYSEQEDLDLENAPVAFLQKPFSYKELTAKARELLDEASKKRS